MSKPKINSTTILIALVVVAAVFIPVRFGFDNLNILQSEADQIRQEADTYNASSDETENDVVVKKDDFELREQRAQQAIPQTPMISSVIDRLAQEASAANLVWLSGTPSSVTPPEGVGAATSLSISLTTADGSTGGALVSAVGDFLDRVRGLDRLVVVDRVNLNPDDGSATVEARFFSQNGDD